jgi:hypothetical protein
VTTGHLTTSVRKAAPLGAADFARPAVSRAALGAGAPALLHGDAADLAAASLQVIPETSPERICRARRAVREITTWLAGFGGETWQQRWVASGADRGGRAWRGEPSKSRRADLIRGAQALICLGVIHPDYPWLLGTGFNSLFATYQRSCDPDGFTRVRQALAGQGADPRTTHNALYHLARIRIAAARPLDAVTGDDLIDCHWAVRDQRKPATPVEALWRALHSMEIIAGPARLKAVVRHRRHSIDELVDRHQVACRPVRDLIAAYLRERAPVMDYGSLSNLTHWLAELFWGDLERHHPGIASLNLPPDVADAWKQRIATRPDGKPRRERYGLLTAVRAFYDDINQWAYDDPARWLAWAAPCPVTRTDLAARRKAKAEVTARMHARTRTLADALPHLVTAARTRREHARALLATARGIPGGQTFTVDGIRYRRIANATRNGLRVLVQAHPDGQILDAVQEEDFAFWAWAAIEVLRLSGLRIEEAMELTHLSIRRYTQPTGEIIPLLQVAPSKLNAERVLPID